MSNDLTAVGIHVFAGGFTRGVLDAGWKVPVQLEKHGFGLETTESMNGVPTINDANWPRVEGRVAFGNPRCTAFSTITSGDRYVEGNTHGAWAKQTCDIHELCQYSAGHYDFVIWESVQQAYKASGREMVDFLIKEHFADKRYRVAHLFINAATFGNCQQRKRYFFVAYRDCYKFNVEPPPLPQGPYYPVLWDVIKESRNIEGRESRLRAGEYDEDCYTNLTEDEWAVVSKLPNGWSLQQMAQYDYDSLTPKFKRVWDERMSDLPFSLHGIVRLNWLRPCPTLHSSAGRFLHPRLHRPLTVGELSKIMGWPRIPVGDRPVAQIAKGIVPAIGEWLTRQVELSINDHWGNDDWESSYDDSDHEWKGRDTTGQLEKTIDMTRYAGKLFDEGRYDDEALSGNRLDVAIAARRLTAQRKAAKLAER